MAMKEMVVHQELLSWDLLIMEEEVNFQQCFTIGSLIWISLEDSYKERMIRNYEDLNYSRS